MLKKGRENFKLMQKIITMKKCTGQRILPKLEQQGNFLESVRRVPLSCQHHSYMPVIKMCRGQSKISASPGLSTGWRQSLLLCEAAQIWQNGPKFPGVLLCPLPISDSSARIPGESCLLQLCVGSEDLNSAPPVCTERTLPTGQSPQLVVSVFSAV